MSLTLPILLERGYFPQELPPPFTSHGLAAFGNAPLPFTTPPRRSRPEIFNLARTGTLRRQLSILNPIHFSLLAELVVANWSDLEKAATTSIFSLSAPSLTDSKRAIGRKHPMSARPARRAECYARGKYLLRADISRFYPSAYTHSIPWALHGKLLSKQNAKNKIKLLGDNLDEKLRNCQDAQTNGIPIGPDTSLLIAEIILCQVDAELQKRNVIGLRYMDDYELVFESESEALEGLAAFQQTLLGFELHLNPAKTKIVPLPQRIEEIWADELRSFEINPNSPSFGSQLIHFFDKAFDLAATHPDSGVLKYAAGRMSNIRTWKEHYPLVEDLLVQCARAESGALFFVLNTLLRVSAVDAARTERRKNLFVKTILEHAPRRHSSEVAWALWACIAQKFVVPTEALKRVVQMEDSVCALLALHARTLDLAESPAELEPLQAAITAEELYDSRWMLAYEAMTKGWLATPAGGDFVAADANFSKLKAAGVTFYDTSKVTLSPPPVSKPKVELLGDYESEDSDETNDEMESYF